MRKVTVAATQMSCTWDKVTNITKAEKLVREAHAQGAQIILLQELFETPYFCIEINEDYHALASTLEENETFAISLTSISGSAFVPNGEIIFAIINDDAPIIDTE